MAENVNLIERTLNGTGDSDKHLMLLYSIVVGSGAKTILELGVRAGDSTVPLVMGAKLTNGMVYSVDINPSPLILSEDLKLHNKFFQQNAIDFLLNWDININIDIVFLDDWHEYGHVKKELEILDKLMTPSSIILLHDLMYETYPRYHSEPYLKNFEEFGQGGPYRAVAELNPIFWEWATFPWNHGLTLLRKKDYVPQTLPLAPLVV